MNNELTAKISLQILALQAAGMTLPEAFDKVLGEGAFLKLAGEIHDELTA